MNRIETPHSWASQIAIVSGVTEKDKRLFLTDEEHEWLASIRSERKRLDSAGARIAAKIVALERGLCGSPSECQVVRSGVAPVLLVHGAVAELTVSLSHSEGIAAGGIFTGSAGIDLQVLRPVNPRTAKFFLADDEVPMLSRDHSLLHLWCAKEAAWKASASAGSTLTSVRLRLVDETQDIVSFAYQVAGATGVVETRFCNPELLLAVAQGD